MKLDVHRREAVRRLVADGQLEFVGAGWVANPLLCLVECEVPYRYSMTRLHLLWLRECMRKQRAMSGCFEHWG